MRFNFCPNCGYQLPLTTYAFSAQTCTNCGRTHYHNSKPCAGALIVKDGKVLLVKRSVEPFKGYWDLPGGFLEPGEHPFDGMLREMREETGLDVRVKELLGVYMDRYFRHDDDEIFTLNVYYIVEPVSGEPRAADDVSELAWFGMDELPQMAFEHEKQVLEELKRQLRHRINSTAQRG